MTVLVVVLLCMFAAIQRSPLPCPTCAGETEPHGGTGEILPETLPEVESTLLRNLRTCALRDLRKQIATFRIASGSFEIRVCNIESGPPASEFASQCLANLQAVNQDLTSASSLDVLKERYAISFLSLYLRAQTRLGSADSVVLKDGLKQAQEYLKTLHTGALGPFGLLPQQYHEIETEQPSEIWFAITTKLSNELRFKIKGLWDTRNKTQLQEILRQSGACEGIPN
jgi:hypothetical protein